MLESFGCIGYHMKHVVLWLTDAGKLAYFAPLIEELRGLGIGVEAYLAEERPPEKSHALYLTDSAAGAGRLEHAGLPVLAYLHEENREEDFGGIAYGMESPEEIGAEYLERVYRRLMKLPWEILTTGRCILRETMVEDVDAFVKIYAEPSVTRYTEGLYEDPEQEKQYIREYIDKVYRYYEYGVWTVLWKETGEIIGRAGFSTRPGYDLPELGFVIALPWQGKGIAGEICRAILQYGVEILGFSAVQTLVRPQNASSLALCKKLGFEERGDVRERDQVTGVSHLYRYLVWTAPLRGDSPSVPSAPSPL